MHKTGRRRPGVVAGDARTPCPLAADRMGKGGPRQASCVLSALGRKEK